MRPAKSFTAVLLASAALPAFANERLGGGLGSLIVVGLAIAVMAGLMFGLGALGEFINRLSGRSGDSDFGSFVVMVGLFCSPFGGAAFAILSSNRKTTVEDFVIGSVLWFIAVLWIASKRH